MMAIYRKELRKLLSGIGSYILIGVILLFCGIFTVGNNLALGSADFATTLTTMLPVLAVVLPILAMNTLSEERQTGGDLLLYTLPLSTAEIIWGKFLACMTVFLIPSVIMAIYPLVFLSMGTPSLSTIFLAWLGYLLAGASVIALCVFLSALCKTKKWAAAVCIGSVVLLFLAQRLLGVSAIVTFLTSVVLLLVLSLLVWRATRRLWAGAVTAIIGIITLFLFYLLGTDLFFAAMPQILNFLNPFSHFANLVTGYLDLSAILFYLCFTVIFLLLTGVTLNYQRRFSVIEDACPAPALTAEDCGEEEYAAQEAIEAEAPISAPPSAKKHKRSIALISLVLSAFMIAINIATSLLPLSATRFNVTGEKTYQISSKTADYLKALDRDVTLYYVSSGGKARVDQNIYSFLQHYTGASKRIRLQIIAPDEAAQILTGGETPTEQALIVASQARYRMLSFADLYYYHNEALNLKVSPYEYQTYLAAYVNQDSSNYMAYYYGAYLYQYAAYTSLYFDGESNLTNAIRYVALNEAPVTYLMAESGGMPDSGWLYSLLQNGYDLKGLAAGAAIPADCSVLLLHAPAKDISAETAERLSAYLGNGGSLLLTTTTNIVSQPVLLSLLSEYGMSAPDQKHYLCEGVADFYVSDSSSQTSYPEYMIAPTVAPHAATGDFNETFITPEAHAITLTPTDGVTHTEWLSTTQSAYKTVYDTETKVWVAKSETRARYTYGAIAEKAGGKLIWIASPNVMAAAINDLANGGNYKLLFSVMNALSGSTETGSIAISAVKKEQATLNVTQNQLVAWVIVAVVLLPVSFAGAGIAVYFHRKKKQI